MSSARARKRKHSPRPSPISGFVRVGGLAGIGVPYGISTVWAKVKRGEFPAPIRLPGNVTVWKVAIVLEFLEDLARKASESSPITRGQRLTAARLRKERVDSSDEVT